MNCSYLQPNGRKANKSWPKLVDLKFDLRILVLARMAADRRDFSFSIDRGGTFTDVYAEVGVEILP